MTKRACFILLAAVLLWAFGAMLDSQTFFFLSGIFLAVPVISLPLSLNAVRGLKCSRANEGNIRQGEEAEITLTLSASRRHLGPMLLTDTNPAVDDNQPYHIWLSGIERGQDLEITYRRPACNRGDHLLGPLVVTSGDPLGIYRWRFRCECSGRLLVYPRWEAITFASGRISRQSYLVGAARNTVEGSGQEFFGVREYRRGDQLRQMHWRSTARRGNLMVKQFMNETHPNIVIHIDTFPAGEGEEPDRTQLDRCAGVAASLGIHLLDTTSHITCSAPGHAPEWFAPGGHAQREMLLQYLARLPQVHKITRATGLLDTLKRLGGGDTLVAVLARLDSETAGVVSAYAYGGRDAIVLIPGGQSQSADQAIHHGLRARGVAVVPCGPEGGLERALQAWQE